MTTWDTLADPPTAPLPATLRAPWLKPAGTRHGSIADDLRGKVEEGLIERGAKVPSHAALAEAYACSPRTAGRALALLEREGVIERIIGLGFYVRPYSGAPVAGHK
jgi:DNA-binding GntR family transcriptional regulator